MASSPPPLPPPLRPHTRTLSQQTLASNDSASPPPSKPTSPTFARPTLTSLTKSRASEVRPSTKPDPSTNGSKPRRGATAVGPEHPALSRRASLSPTNSSSPSSYSKSASASLVSSRSRASSSAATSSNRATPAAAQQPPPRSSFFKGMAGRNEGPPSPPATASDGNSNGSGLTIGLSSGSAMLNRIDMGRDESDLERNGDRSRLPFEIPTIQHSSPTIVGSPLSSRAKRLSAASSSGGSSNTTSLHRRQTSLSPTSSTSALPRMRSGASLSLDLGNPGYRRSGGSNSPLSSPRNIVGREILYDEGDERRTENYFPGSTPTERNWTNQDNDPPVVGERDLEARRAARARRAAELKSKNQRILDSINSTIKPLASPPASYRSPSPRQPSRSTDSGGSRPRMSSDLDRPDAQSPVSLTPTTASPFERRSPAPVHVGNGNSEARSSQSSANAAPPTRQNQVDEFVEREKRVRTIGQSGRSTPISRGPRDRTKGGDQERSYTSLSNYPGGPNDERREGWLKGENIRDDWLGREYERTRAVTSVGSREKQRLESSERIEGRNSLELDTRGDRISSTTGPRRRHSEADRNWSTLARDDGFVESLNKRENSGSSTPASIRRRPALPREFTEPLSTPSSSLSNSRAVKQLDREAPHSASPSVREFSRQPRDSPFDRTQETFAGTSRRAQSRSETRPSETSAGTERRKESFDYSPSSDRRLPSPGLASPSPWSRAKHSSNGSESGGSASARMTARLGNRSRQSQNQNQVVEERPGSGARSPAARFRTQSLLSGKSVDARTERDEAFRNSLQDLESEEEEVLEDQFNRSASRQRRVAPSAASARGSEYLNLDQGLVRNTRSRASGSSGGDARSSRSAPQALLDDRTVRGGPASSQGRRDNESEGSGDAPQSTADRVNTGRHVGPLSTSNLARRPSTPREPTLPRSSVFPRTESRNGTARADPGHYDLLQQAYDRFVDRESRGTESNDLIARVLATIQASTKVNSGLQTLRAISHEAQIEAEMDETQRSGSTTGLGQFNRNLQSLLRTSDDQMRTFTEMLLALSSADRERERLRRELEGGTIMSASRPASRAATTRGPPSPSKRASMSSPFEPATISTSSSRAVTSSGSRLRNPFIEDSPDSPYRLASPVSRGSPFSLAQDSPTPSSSTRRGNSVHTPSPLVTSQRAVTPSQNDVKLPFPSSGGRSAARRAKSSSTSTATVRATSPTPAPILFPKSHVAGSHLDATNASSFESPTHGGYVTSRHDGQRTWSDVSAELYALPDAPEHRDARRTLNGPPSYLANLRRSPSPETTSSFSNAGNDSGKSARHRLSTGSFLGSGMDILRSSLTRAGRKTISPTEDRSTSPSASHSKSAESVPRRSFEVVRRERRRRESEEMGRAGRGSFS